MGIVKIERHRVFWMDGDKKNKLIKLKRVIRGNGKSLSFHLNQTTNSLNDEGHVLFAGQVHLFALPEGVVYCKCINCDGQVFGVYLSETFTARIIPEKYEIFKVKLKKCGSSG
jgi:hypothetical protein